MNTSLTAQPRKDRVMLAISKDLHSVHQRIANLLDMNLCDATEEAVQEWNQRHARLARSRAKQLLKRIP